MQDLPGNTCAFLDKYAIDYPTIRDQGDGMARSYGATGIPETYFIDPRGRMFGPLIGAISPQTLSEGVGATRSGRVLGLISGEAQRTAR